MTLSERLAAAVRDADSIPRWRVGLYAFVAGAGVVAAGACFGLGSGLVAPQVEREVEVRTVVRERVVTKTAKRTNVVTMSTPGLLRVPDGGVLLAYTTVTRDLSMEDSESTGERGIYTAQKSMERPALPSWTVGVLVGGQFAGKPALTIPNAPGLVLGVEAGYRVPLPLPPRYSVWVGGFATTSGAAGGSVRGEF